LGETPERVLNEVADTALTWMKTHSDAYVTSPQLSEWLHDAVWKSVEHHIEDMRSVSQRAVFTLQSVAQELGRIDMPSPDEVESLLRDMPRFELPSLPNAINMSTWKFLGTSVVRVRIRKALREGIGAVLKQELHHYGDALLVGSYADAYRVQLQRMSGTSNSSVDEPQLEQDLALLRNWSAIESHNVSETIERGA
jgi:hypothetical protein